MINTALYKLSPIWLQEILISARSSLRNLVRENRKFHHILEEIERTQWYSRDELREFQLRNIKAILHHCMENIPYYNYLFSRENIHIEDIRSLADMARIPCLEKAAVLKHTDKLIAKNIRGIKIKVNTSGSTGTPLVISQNLDAVIRENAFIWRQLHWAGYCRGQRRAWIRGDMVVPFEQQMPPFWRRNVPDNMLMMSSYHLSALNASEYIAALELFDPVLIQAYPSSIAYLARFLDMTGREYKGTSLKAVVTTSETLTDADRVVIERRMGCRIYQQYGSAERVTMIHTCEKGRYHIDADYSFTELLPLDDGTYEIVGTGFNNWLMPLVRYRSGDTLEIDPLELACPCGRQLPIVKRIHGRKDDYLKTVDGRKIGRLDHIFKGVNNVAEAQLIQDRSDEVTVRIVPFMKFSDKDKFKLVANAHERLGISMNINVELVAAIPRTQNGKFRAVICNV